MSEEEFYRIEDPEQDLYLTRIDKNIIVKRRSDDEQISSTYIREWSQLTDCHWDTIMGQFLSIVFTDGSVRLIDVNDNGKLISLIRTTLNNIDASYWGRIIEVSIESDIPVMNIARNLPRLIKYNMENGSIKMEPFNLTTKKWRQNKNSTIEDEYLKIIDVHVLHSEIDDRVSFILNGGIVFEIPGDSLDSHGCKIICEKPDIFELWYRNGHKRVMDLTKIISSKSNITFVEDIMEFQELLQYLRHHVNFLQNNIIKPYADFLNRITSVSFDRNKLYQELRQMILIGEVSDELSDWLQYTIGERNIQKWREMSSRTYQKTTEILELAIIPAVERTLILTQRCSGSMAVLDNNIETILPDFYNINIKLKEIVTQTIYEMGQSNEDSEYVRQFLNWIHDYIHEISGTENFIPQVQYNYEPTIVKHLIATLKPICLSETPMEPFFSIDDFNIKLKLVTDIVKNKIINKFIIPKLESLIITQTIESIFPNHEQMKYYKLLDIDVFEIDKKIKDVTIMVYKCSQDPNTDRVSVGTMEGIFVHLTLPPCQVTSAKLTTTQLYELRTGHVKMFNVIIEAILLESGTIEYLEYLFEIKPLTRGATIIDIDRDSGSYATDWFAQNFIIEQISPRMTENYYITSQPI